MNKEVLVYHTPCFSKLYHSFSTATGHGYKYTVGYPTTHTTAVAYLLDSQLSSPGPAAVPLLSAPLAEERKR